MADVVFVALIGAFFASCVSYIGWCDRIVGADDVVPAVNDESGEDTDLPVRGVSA